MADGSVPGRGETQPFESMASAEYTNKAATVPFEGRDASVPIDSNPTCARCGGPHPFDTSVPSVRWNEVIRGNGWPDYLCLTCIVTAFGSVARNPSFTAELWGLHFHGLPVEVVFRGQTATDAAEIQAENNSLRAQVETLIGEKASFLSALDGISPSLLNTPKRNRAGEVMLSVDEAIRLAVGDVIGLIQRINDLENESEKLEAENARLRQRLVDAAPGGPTTGAG